MTTPADQARPGFKACLIGGLWCALGPFAVAVPMGALLWLWNPTLEVDLPTRIGRLLLLSLYEAPVLVGLGALVTRRGAASFLRAAVWCALALDIIAIPFMVAPFFLSWLSPPVGQQVRTAGDRGPASMALAVLVQQTAAGAAGGLLTAAHVRKRQRKKEKMLSQDV